MLTRNTVAALFGSAANQISLSRLLLVPALLWRPRGDLLVVLHLTLLSLFFSLDMLDGIVARRWGLASPVGASIDLLADRLMEMTLWIYFVLVADIPPIIALIVIARFCLVDGGHLCLNLAGTTPSGDGWLAAGSTNLVASRWVKGTYCTLKCGLFALLLIRADTATSAFPPPGLGSLLVALVLVNLLRGVPVVLQAFAAIREGRLQGRWQVGAGSLWTQLLILQVIVDAFFLNLLVPYIVSATTVVQLFWP
jgi:phosphatidylglycerophosphate synthase